VEPVTALPGALAALAALVRDLGPDGLARPSAGAD
jgi:hypothetical protein